MQGGFLMSLIPDEELCSRHGLNFAPMVDFLFIVIAIFAVVAITRKALYDAQVTLVQHQMPAIEESIAKKNRHDFHVSITPEGTYRWLTDSNHPILDSIESVKQMVHGASSEEKSDVHILLHIDQEAKWHPIAKLIFAMHEEGFTIYPIYEKVSK
jgi:biopolymer transport protein ExbD